MRDNFQNWKWNDIEVHICPGTFLLGKGVIFLICVNMTWYWYYNLLTGNDNFRILIEGHEIVVQAHFSDTGHNSVYYWHIMLAGSDNF